jgi:hypothetical protein
MAVPFQEVQWRLAAQASLHNVVISGVRQCQLPETLAFTTRQLEGADVHMPAGVRICSLSRHHDGNVSGPVLVTCRMPEPAFHQGHQHSCG